MKLHRPGRCHALGRNRTPTTSTTPSTGSWTKQRRPTSRHAVQRIPSKRLALGQCLLHGIDCSWVPRAGTALPQGSSLMLAIGHGMPYERSFLLADLSPFGHVTMCPEETQALAHGMLQCGWTSEPLQGKLLIEISVQWRMREVKGRSRYYLLACQRHTSSLFKNAHTS